MVYGSKPGRELVELTGDHWMYTLPHKYCLGEFHFLATRLKGMRLEEFIFTNTLLISVTTRFMAHVNLDANSSITVHKHSRPGGWHGSMAESKSHLQWTGMKMYCVFSFHFRAKIITALRNGTHRFEGRQEDKKKTGQTYTRRLRRSASSGSSSGAFRSGEKNYEPTDPTCILQRFISIATSYLQASCNSSACSDSVFIFGFQKVRMQLLDIHNFRKRRSRNATKWVGICKKRIYVLKRWISETRRMATAAMKIKK